MDRVFATLRDGWTTSQAVLLFVAFLGGFVLLFVLVGPVPVGPFDPRPEAFLLALALAFRLPAVLGGAAGVPAALAAYRVVHPYFAGDPAAMALTEVDMAASFLAVLVAMLAAYAVFARRGPGHRLAATWVLTLASSTFLALYAAAANGVPFVDGFAKPFSEAFLPVNVVGWLVLEGLGAVRGKAAG
jgi:hypothetical protein